MKLNSFILSFVILLSLISFSSAGFAMENTFVDTERNEQKIRAVHVARSLLNNEIHETDSYTYSRIHQHGTANERFFNELNAGNLLIKMKMIFFWPPQSIMYWVIFTKKDKPYKSIMDITFLEHSKILLKKQQINNFNSEEVI